MRITVPAGFKSGSTLTFKSPGGECSVQVPSGLQEGDSLQVALPHVEQKIAILSAYFGRDDEPHPKSTGPGTLGAGFEHAARSVIDQTHFFKYTDQMLVWTAQEGNHSSFHSVTVPSPDPDASTVFR